MDEGAKYGIAAHWSYKMGGQSNAKSQPTWVKEVLNIQKETENTSDFIKQMKFDVFRDRIFVFTPKGDVFDLPEGSTPIDFAYYVHSDIGNRATGARVNDSISTLDKELKNGDLVEIITEKKRKGPSNDWLKFVKTATARNKIKQNLKSSMIDSLKKFIPKI